MKNALLIICFLCLSINLYSQIVTIKGNIIGLTEKTILFAYGTGGEFKTDTLYLDNGKFTWSKVIKGPQKAMLFLPYESVPIFIEPGNIEIEGNVAVPDTLCVNGSKTHDEARIFYRKLDKLSIQKNSLYRELDHAKDDEKPHVRLTIAAIDREYKREQHAYITANRSSVISISIVRQIIYTKGFDDGVAAFNLLKDKVKYSLTGKKMKQELWVMRKSQIGAVVPDFIQNDPNGQPINLASFRGKYVYIDFWASWCVPCRNENPNVLYAYEKYKSKNFTVIGISLDSDLNSWKKAIADDKMPWTMVSDLKGFKNQIAEYFGITGIPSTLLIDPEGKIIAKDLVGEKLHYKLDELFSAK